MVARVLAHAKMRTMTVARVALGSICLSLSLVACSASDDAANSGKGGAGGKSNNGAGGQASGGASSNASGGATTSSTGGSSGGASGGSSGGSVSAGGAVGSGGQQSGGAGSGNGGNVSNNGGNASNNGGNVSTGGTVNSSGGQNGQSGGSTASGGTTSSTGGKSGSGGQQSGGTTGTTGGASGTGGSTTGPGKQGERFPFPQNVKYPHGFQSTKVTNDFVRSWYENWKKTRLVNCNGNLMPGTDDSSTAKVEAQGFAMVAVAYMGDKDVFDKLYSFYQSKTSSTGCGLSGWQTSCGGVTDPGAATDGDIDVASGLVVAHWQWPNAGYDTKAKALISNLRKMLLDCSGKWTVYPGCSGGKPWGGCNETDISYYSPAFFRYFAKISGDSAWSKLADDTQKIRDAAANSSTGLVPDWQSVSGTAGAGTRAGNYGFDAIRAPYKQCLDYLWNGTPEALTWCKKISSWAYGQGVNKITDGYQLNGSPSSNNHNLASVGSLTIAAMTNTQEMADAFVGESVKMKDDYWYSSYLGNLYLLAMSGNMWNPDILGAN
jgi:endo-1,4-beta-D-glucanase Y